MNQKVFSMGKVKETMKRLVRLLVVALLALGVAGIGSAHPALAATLTVTDCSGETGSGRIGTVIASASAGDTINFNCTGTIPITSTLTISTNNLTLDGSGQGVTLDGGGSLNGTQLFSVNSGVTFSLTGLTLQNGRFAAEGGAIDNFGTVTITNSTLSGNSGGQGGAIDNTGTVTITNSTLSGNSGGFGGAIDNRSGTVTITNSTLSGNSTTTSGTGGAIYNNFGTVTITNSTLSGNSGGLSGAIDNSSGRVATIGGSIIANSVNETNCSGTITDNGYNLEDDAGPSCGFSAANHDIIGQNPDLGPLQNNGGPTQTIALQSTSPAIGVIPAGSAGCPKTTGTDQRGPGYARPDNSETSCDIGAYEFADPSSDFSISAGPNMLSIAQGSSGTSTISTSVTSGSAGTVTLSASVSPAGPTASLSPTSVTAGGSSTVTISVGPSVAPGSYAVTVTGTEGSATHSTSVTVTVTDIDLGQPTVPPNITTPATSAAGAVVSWSAQTASDEGGETPTVTCQSGTSLTSGSTFPIGTTTVTCTATDSDDTPSTASKTFTVTVIRYKVKLLYKAPMNGKVGSAVPIKIELVNFAGQDVSSSSLTVQALCVIPANAATQTCASALPGFTYTNQLFTFMSGLDTGGGYQYNVKTTGLPTSATYLLLFQVGGEDAGSYHADAGATFTLTK